MRPGYAAGDGAALHFAGERLLRVVSSRPGARAFRMRSVRGRVIKSPLRVSYLGDAAPVVEPHAAEARRAAAAARARGRRPRRRRAAG